MLIPISDQAGELRPEIGIIGGSGFYEFIDDPVEVRLHTPFGEPADAITVGTVAGRTIAFLARHGRRHEYAAHRVPYRANIWALASLGVRAVIAPCSVGALHGGLQPGDFVIVDQLVDRTWGRPDTFHDHGAPAGTPGAETPLHHQSFADPYDAALRSVLIDAARHCEVTVHERGTMVVINGPRFSTRAESRWFRDMGWDVVNMTGYPEAVLAAEAGIPYASIALVTDHDAGVEGHEPVTMNEILDTVRSNIGRVRVLIETAVPRLITG